MGIRRRGVEQSLFFLPRRRLPAWFPGLPRIRPGKSRAHALTRTLFTKDIFGPGPIAKSLGLNTTEAAVEP
jgi:hypothetical protein